MNHSSPLHSRDSFEVVVNGNTLSVADPEPQARQLLDAAGFSPAEDCVLIQLVPPGTRQIGLDETVSLRKPGKETFWAFKADRLYRFTVRGHEYAWGAPVMKEPMLRMIAHVSDHEILILERSDEPDKQLGSSDEIRLSEAGTEHFRVESRLIQVFFENNPVQIPRGVYTTEELMRQFPMTQGFLLNLQTDDCDLVTLKPDEKIRVKPGMCFFEQNPGGGSS